jgi:hypothetical protein
MADTCVTALLRIQRDSKLSIARTRMGQLRPWTQNFASIASSGNPARKFLHLHAPEVRSAYHGSLCY